MFDERMGNPSAPTRAASEAWLDAARPVPASDQKSVPDGPPKVNPKPKVLGPGALAGTLVADPEIKFTGNGKAFTKVRLAKQDRTRDEATGQWVDGETTYVDVTVWGRQAENAAECLNKGDRIVVTGIWQEESWYGRDEQWHTKRTMTARDIGPSLMFKQARVIRTKEGS